MAEPFGPYQLERTINVGSIGEVFLARRTDGSGTANSGGEPHGPVVIKRLHRELAHRSVHVQLFVEEGRVARRFRHPNLVHAFDAGAVERSARSPDRRRGDSTGDPPAGADHYIAMELVRGPNLAQLVERAPPSPRAALRIAVDLLGGLEHMHTSGVVHCDVSPTNILIGRERALLTDFGVTNPVGEAQPQVRGTVPYMSPEQARGLPVDGRSDVFAVGAILWELLARRPLFLRSAPYLSLAAVVEDEAPDLAGAAGPALAALAPLLARALAKEPAARYASCAELSAALSEAASSVP
jgi:eukaryotic-like serine/threonine-protein kinase